MKQANAVFGKGRSLSFTPTSRLALQRKCACGNNAGASGECQACASTTASLHRKADSNQKAGEVPAIVDQVLGSPGRPLADDTRAHMESRFGHDFSRVRVHTDAKAADSARAVNALAYTAGSDMVFKTGQYAPGTEAGQRLLTHELAHVVQQGGRGVQRPLSLGRQGDTYEREADTAARSVGSGSARQPFFLRGGSSRLQIQRQAESEDDLAVSDIGAEEDASDVRDGDSPVSVSPDTTEASEEEPGLAGNLPSEAGALPGILETPTGPVGRGPGESIPMQAGSAQGKDKPTTPPPAKKTSPKTITTMDVDQAAQKMTVTWSDGSKETHSVSTGRGLPNTKSDPCKDQKEKNCTPNGSFKVGSLGNASTKNEHGDQMSWYVGFVDSRGIGIHDSQPVPGVPHSHGCVRVGDSPADDAFAKKINKNVVPGSTTVNVHGKASTKPWTKPVPAPKTSKSKKK